MSRLRALAPLLVACVLALVLQAWWPVQLVGLMLAVGLALDPVWYRLVPYQPGWAALPLGLLELGLVMGLAWPARRSRRRCPARSAFFVGSWLLAQALGHAVFPLAAPHGEDGGELDRVGPAGRDCARRRRPRRGRRRRLGDATAGRPPVRRRPPGPLVLDHSSSLSASRGGRPRRIVVTADDVSIRNVTVIGADHGIQVENAEDVVIERVSVLGAHLDGINVRMSEVTIRDCSVLDARQRVRPGNRHLVHRASRTKHGRELSADRRAGRHLPRLGARDGDRQPRPSDDACGITVTEMAMATVDGNTVEDGVGIGILCSDYSMCDIRENSISGSARSRIL